MLLPSLAERLASKHEDPFSLDIVVVPSIGVADYIVEALSSLWGTVGLVANTKFWLPNEFNLNAGVHVDYPYALSDSKISQWLILEYLVRNSHHGREPAPGFLNAKKKFSFAQRVAQLFDGYAVHRPEMIAEWMRGKDSDGFRDLPPNLVWQPKLWRALFSEAQELEKNQAHVRISENELNQVDLATTRFSLFGLESFSRAKIELLRRLSGSTDIAVFHVAPFPMTLKVMRDNEVIVSSLRHDAEFPYSFRNPLLRSWGQSSLENGALLSTISTTFEQKMSTSTPSVLSALQNTFAHDEMGTGVTDQKLLQNGDSTIQVHLCHGPTRQVEVLRDALLHLLKADPTLRPRDIVVLCKDIENFEPLLDPIMSAKLGDRQQQLSVTVLDSVSATATPVATAINTLFSLLANRCTLLEILEVLSLEPIRQRFNFSEESLGAITRWTSNLNVNWGLNASHREKWAIPGEYEHGTWQLAIDRLVAGIFNQSTELTENFLGVAAYDDISGSDIETICNLHKFISEVTEFSLLCEKPHTIEGWSQILERLIETFIEVESDEQSWLFEARSLAEMLYSQSGFAPTAQLNLQEFSEIVANNLPSLRKGARKWHDVVRIGTPNRLRGVAARVIAVLGFDEEIFRGAGGAGDDILAREPRLGERDLRLEERLGMLCAINSASDYFLITCNGHDVNNNKPVPLPVPLIELMDAVSLAVSTIPESARLSVPVVISHSRQLADAVNIGLPGDSAAKNVQKLLSAPWTFDATAIEVVARLSERDVRASATLETKHSVVLSEPSEIEETASIELADVVNSVRRPLDVFVQTRLGILLPRDEDAPDVSLQLWPDPLKYSEIGRNVLAGMSVGRDLVDIRKFHDLDGTLPFGDLGHDVWTRITAETQEISNAVQNIVGQTYEKLSFEVRLTEDADQSVEKVVLAQAQTYGDTVLSMNFARWSRRFRLEPWFQISALTLHQPEIEWKACVVSRPSAKSSNSKSSEEQSRFVMEEFELKGLTPEERRESATKVLKFGLSLRSRSQRVPIPLFERSSWIPDKSKSDRADEVKRDLKRPSHQLIYPDFQLEDFQKEIVIPEIDLSLDETSSRFEGYSKWLMSTWGETTLVTRHAEPVKVKKEPKSKKLTSTNETQENEMGE
jgi:exodeoxyribonuclease V gamma subunit